MLSILPEYAAQFPQHPGLIYLNHASVAPWPKPTCDAVTRFAEENMHQGARDYPAWIEIESRLRQGLTQLINAPSVDDIALLKSTSEALSTVAYGIDWKPGDNVVSFAQEFPSNRIVWESLTSLGVELRLADLHDAEDPETALLALCDRRTRLVSCSAVQYADGYRVDINRIGQECRAGGILFCVDAIQMLGALPFDVQACQADFVMADGHKWMLGAEGLALFYCRVELREQLRLNQYGWHMLEHSGDFDRLDWAPATNARRFECGSPNMLGIYALCASVEFLLGVGLDAISINILRNTSLIIDLIDNYHLRLITPIDSNRHSGIVTFDTGSPPPRALYRHLMGMGVICAQRGGGVRFSPHFYTNPDVFPDVFDIIKEFVDKA